MKPSKLHTNRQWHNWLVYNINDKFLLAHSRLFKGTMYDFGCGNTPYKTFFLKSVDKYIGVDWTESYHNIKADITADLNKELPIDSALADTIISLSVLEHLYSPQTMLKEAYRVLKPNGNIIIQVPWQWRLHEEPHDYFRYTPHALRYMLNKEGFKDICIEPQGGFFTMQILKFNYFCLRFVRGPKVIKALIRLPLLFIWTIGQILAPFLDKLDTNWSVEAPGYYVTAKK